MTAQDAETKTRSALNIRSMRTVYESARYAGKHDTIEFRVAMSDARQKDMSEDGDNETNYASGSIAK